MLFFGVVPLKSYISSSLLRIFGFTCIHSKECGSSKSITQLRETSLLLPLSKSSCLCAKVGNPDLYTSFS